MKTALIQLGPGLPALEIQASRLRSLHPDGYHIEETPTAQAAQRILERLERLGYGEELQLFSLTVLRRDAGETGRLIEGLLRRGVKCLTFNRAGRLFRITANTRAADMLHLLSEVQEDHLQAGIAGGQPLHHPEQLLTEEEIDDIRRLARAGLTARRIGLIYRRAPDCIRALLRHQAPHSAIVSDAPHRNLILHSKAAR